MVLSHRIALSPKRASIRAKMLILVAILGFDGIRFRPQTLRETEFADAREKCTDMMHLTDHKTTHRSLDFGKFPELDLERAKSVFNPTYLKYWFIHASVEYG